jgi:hypothetical protein
MEPMDRGNTGTSVAFEIFDGTLITWEELFQQAANFASGIGPDRLIGISHSDNHGRGVVTVWYWR